MRILKTNTTRDGNIVIFRVEDDDLGKEFLIRAKPWGQILEIDPITIHQLNEYHLLRKIEEE